MKCFFNMSLFPVLLFNVGCSLFHAQKVPIVWDLTICIMNPDLPKEDSVILAHLVQDTDSDGSIQKTFASLKKWDNSCFVGLNEPYVICEYQSSQGDHLKIETWHPLLERDNLIVTSKMVLPRDDVHSHDDLKEFKSDWRLAIQALEQTHGLRLKEIE